MKGRLNSAIIALVVINALATLVVFGLAYGAGARSGGKSLMQPGSLRDSAVSFSKIAATSDSRPTFAIQVTANTTIRRSLRG